MANKDYFDRIADALQIISGNDSHVDDVDKNMDYYKRIAEALQNIAESGGGGGGSSESNEILAVTMDTTSFQLDHTWQEIQDSTFCILNFINNGEHDRWYLVATSVEESSNNYAVQFKNLLQVTAAPMLFLANSANEYPHYVHD